MLKENEALGNMIDLVGDKDYEAATGVFNDLMGEKLQTVLDQEKIKVADSIYNGIEADDSLEGGAGADGIGVDADGDE